MTPAERRAALEAIAADVRDCTRCRLSATRTHAVPGEGDANTEVLFVGEGPGEQEDRQGRPFVGASGQLLTELIASLGWSREDVFITNVVKCRPPGNRDPQPDEIEACAPHLARQLAAIDPAVVVTVGKHSLERFRPGDRISRSHGTTRAIDPATGASNALAFAMYHPAFALYQRSNRPILFEDIQRLPAALVESRERRAMDGAREPSSAAPTTHAAPAVATPPATTTPTTSDAPPAPADDVDQLTIF
ncbi:MAG: uracil-DNA glycosylase family protein [Candidatus Limnocylindria bacterium]